MVHFAVCHRFLGVHQSEIRDARTGNETSTTGRTNLVQRFGYPWSVTPDQNNRYLGKAVC